MPFVELDQFFRDRVDNLVERVDRLDRDLTISLNELQARLKALESRVFNLEPKDNPNAIR